MFGKRWQCACCAAQIERDEQLLTFQSFMNRFRSPYEQSFSTNPLYYSLDVGPIHIIMLNAVRPTRLLSSHKLYRLTHAMYARSATDMRKQSHLSPGGAWVGRGSLYRRKACRLPSYLLSSRRCCTRCGQAGQA